MTGGVWASSSTAVRLDPEDVGIDRTEGWSESYEQIASELEPELGVWNQRYRELDSWATENTRTGGLKQFDADIDYLQYARCGLGLLKYVARVATGPATGNAIRPDATGQQAWLLY